MPITRVIGSPRRLSRSARTIGMPPATAASNSRSTPGLLGGLEQLDADVGEQLLVGGDHRLARREGRGDQLAGRLDATDDLDDEIDVGVGDDGSGVVGEQGGCDLDVAASRQVADGDADDLEVDAGARLDLLRPLRDEADERRSRRCRTRARRFVRACSFAARIRRGAFPDGWNRRADRRQRTTRWRRTIASTTWSNWRRLRIDPSRRTECGSTSRRRSTLA